MFKTILSATTATTVVKKSKFIAHIMPIKSEAEAKQFIEQIKKEHRSARHNVPVYVLGEDYQLQRYSDDGEPSGTAGVPILDMLKKQSITNICCVVTRYFGGIKLGTGGLVRAYTDVVKAALEMDVVTIDSYCQLALELPYHLHGKIEYVVANTTAYVQGTTYAEKVRMILYIIQPESSTLIKKLIETSNNQITIKEERLYGCIYDGQFIEV